MDPVNAYGALCIDYIVPSLDTPPLTSLFHSTGSLSPSKWPALLLLSCYFLPLLLDRFLHSRCSALCVQVLKLCLYQQISLLS